MTPRSKRKVSNLAFLEYITALALEDRKSEYGTPGPIIPSQDLRSLINFWWHDAELRRDIEAGIRASARRWCDLNRVLRALASDDDKVIFGLQECHGKSVVRASAYAEVLPQQELFEHYMRKWLPDNRPVLMRGSRDGIMLRMRWHDQPQNTWFRKVAARYLRQIRYTCSDPAENKRFLRDLEDTLHRRVFNSPWPKLTRGFRLTECPDFTIWHDRRSGKRIAWVDGKKVEASDFVGTCVVCKRGFCAPHQKKTCSASCDKERNRINARRRSAAFAAMKEIGLIRDGDML